MPVRSWVPDISIYEDKLHSFARLERALKYSDSCSSDERSYANF